MKADAEAHAADDKKRREVIDLKNQGESLVYSTEKTLKDTGDKIGGDDRANIERAVGELKDALKTDDGDVIKKKMELLTQASHKLAEEMYKQQSAPGGAAGGAPGGEAPQGGEAPKKDEDVIDAEYEVKDNK